ncbi:hypothetical protein K440DRAFT_664615 [Wilcoxina mikolae CBS 423.85]|nr:hypothetical protein K440DRAFT_664615 [Wilcoxina mikolae CBS 423.85]
MAKDARWPFLPFIIVRSIQLVFGLIILGMTAYIASIGSVWWNYLALFISLVMLIWGVINFVLFFMGLLLPVAVVVVDAFIVFFLLISMAGTAASGYVGSNCRFYIIDYDYTYESNTYWTPCLVAKASFAVELLGMFLFIATLVLASITLHKTRKDLRGKKYNAGLPFVSGSSAQAQDQEQGQQFYAGEQKIEDQPQHYQQPAPVYTQQPQTYYPQPQQQVPLQQVPQQQYQQGPTYDAFVSPPTSPPPPGEIIQHSTGGYTTGGSLPSEMPGAHTHLPPKGNGSELPS